MSSEIKISPEQSLSALSTNELNSVSSINKPSEEYIETVIMLPLDGGWGWVVVIGSFLCHFVLDGAAYTFGVFLGDISETFRTKKTTVSLASSLMTGVGYISGPVICSLVNRLGFQLTGFLGGVTAGIAFACSSVVTSVEVFLVVFGIFVGLGFCAVFIPSIVVIGFYFEKWRALATSIAVTGSAAGIVCFPMIMDFLLAKYTWQLKFRIISGLCLFVALLCLLYRPLKPTKVLTTKDKKVVHLLSRDVGDSVGTFQPNEKPGRGLGFFKRFFRGFHNAAYPTQSQLFKESTLIMAFSGGPSTSSVFLTSVPGSSISTFPKSTSSKTEARSERLEKLSTVYEDEHSFKTKANCKKCFRKFCCDYKCCTWCCGAQVYNRPMYRDDIFYSLSLNVLSEYAQLKAPSNLSKMKNMEYTMSVTRASLTKGQEERLHCKCCPESIVRTLVTMLTFDLLKRPSFLCLALSGFFSTLGMFSPFIYLIQRAQEQGIDKDISLHLFTAVGISNGVGRVASGMISSIPQVECLMVSYISLFVCGISTVISYFLVDVISQFIYATVFGLTIACLASLRSCIVVDLLGLENLTNALGLLLLFSGVAALIGMPIAGKIVELTHYFNYSFIYAGCMLTISAVLLVPIKHISNWEKRK